MEHGNAPHVVVLGSPGMGHFIPMVVFAGGLARDLALSVTLIAHTGDPPSAAEQSLLRSLPDAVDVVLFPQLPAEDFPAGTKIEDRMFRTVMSSLSRLRSLLGTLAPLAALVVDPFCLDAIPVAAELGVASYIFFTSSCMSLSLAFHLHELDASFQGEYRDLPEPVRLPGCVPVHGKDLVEPIQDRGNPVYATFLRIAERYLEAEGVLVNSFEALEPGAIKALREGSSHPPVYPVGPLIRAGSIDSGEGHECLRWLDEQPVGSVVYVSFGSGGALTRAQLYELAMGLEASRQRFLWVAKRPHEHDASATFFGVESDDDDPGSFLPEGFLERTKALGLVVPRWAPQVAVLGHSATGGFVTHCGWNSTLEGLVHGVPLIAWPLYAEQKMNAVLLAEDVKVALRLEADEDGLARGEEIARAIVCLIEGEEGKRLRRRARELSDAAARALERGGSSCMVMLDVAAEWRAQRNTQ
ncbi:hydroquinone glucosyltransferase-like [Musa troglodytarum]|uniref:Glycosyltransferase n=1 Tax=Musa troglodytarum TaxID=320322 RepID=A0A9E7I842_9LILI|nr:hydroquinone glucosyltransferase-like [Musa troglodytarum]